MPPTRPTSATRRERGAVRGLWMRPLLRPAHRRAGRGAGRRRGRGAGVGAARRPWTRWRAGAGRGARPSSPEPRRAVRAGRAADRGRRRPRGRARARSAGSLVVAGGVLVVLVGISQLAGERGHAVRRRRQPGGASPACSWRASWPACSRSRRWWSCWCCPGPASRLSRAPVGRARATARAPCATGGSTRWCSPAPTTPTRPPTSRAGTSPTSATGSRGSCATGSARFLIDIHFGAPDPGSGRIRTDLQAEGSSRNKVARELSPRPCAPRSAWSAAPASARPRAAPRPYLCHTLCELGAEPLDEQLGLVRPLPRRQPARGDRPLRRAVRAGRRSSSGAAGRRPARPGGHDAPSEPLPTLGELIRGRHPSRRPGRAGRRRASVVPAGFSFVQDTPLGATAAGPSCAATASAGEPDSPLLLVNHWIPPFPPSRHPQRAHRRRVPRAAARSAVSASAACRRT